MNTETNVQLNQHNASFGGFKSSEIEVYLASSNGGKSLLSIGATNIEIAPKEYETILNYNDAIKYCQSLVIDGKSDWRLPTKDELNQIYKSTNNLQKRSYWSSTEENDLVNGQNFLSGYYGNYSKNGMLYVRAIRTM